MQTLHQYTKYKEETINNLQQGLEGYFRDPAFYQNNVWDSGKCKIYCRIQDLPATWEAEFVKIVNVMRELWPVCWEIGKLSRLK